MIEKLNDENFLIYAMQHYDNPQCTTLNEFNEDLKRFLYLKKLLSRYRKRGDLQERLILNHLIILHNCFDGFLEQMLFFKINKENWNALATFMVFLNIMPEETTRKVKLDQSLINILRNI